MIVDALQSRRETDLPDGPASAERVVADHRQAFRERRVGQGRAAVITVGGDLADALRYTRRLQRGAFRKGISAKRCQRGGQVRLFKGAALIERVLPDLQQSLRQTDFLQRRAAAEGVIFDRGQSLRQTDVRQRRAAIKAVDRDGRDFFGDIGRFQRDAFRESEHAQRFQRSGQLRFLQRAALIKRVAADAGQPLRQRDLPQGSASAQGVAAKGGQSRAEIDLLQRLTLIKGIGSDLRHRIGQRDLFKRVKLPERPVGHGGDAVFDHDGADLPDILPGIPEGISFHGAFPADGQHAVLRQGPGQVFPAFAALFSGQRDDESRQQQGKGQQDRYDQFHLLHLRFPPKTDSFL